MTASLGRYVPSLRLLLVTTLVLVIRLGAACTVKRVGSLGAVVEGSSLSRDESSSVACSVAWLLTMAPLAVPGFTRARSVSWMVAELTTLASDGVVCEFQSTCAAVLPVAAVRTPPCPALTVSRLGSIGSSRVTWVAATLPLLASVRV